LDIHFTYPHFAVAWDKSVVKTIADIYLYYQINGSALAEVTFRGGYWNMTATIIPVL
jgi:hypothetical protein